MLELDTIHNDIVAQTIHILDEITSEVEHNIDDAAKKFEAHSVPSGGQAYINHIRNIRRNALIYFQPVKTKIRNIVAGTLIQENKVQSLEKLHNLHKEVRTLETARINAHNQKLHIEKFEMALTDYKKFQLYGEPVIKRKTKHNHKKNFDEDIKDNNDSTLVHVHNSYLDKRKKAHLVGGIVTFGCALADFLIMYSLFLLSNLSTRLAILNAAICVAVLDVPPYIFGFLKTKENDRKRFWELRHETDDSGVTIEPELYLFTKWILGICIALIFLSYVMTRGLMFYGGGKFDDAIKALFKIKTLSENIKYNVSDFFSIFIPLGTSAVTFAMGMLLSPSYTDHVKKMVVVIDNELQLRIKSCEEKIADCEEKQKNLNDEISLLKHEIWAFYLGSAPFPPDNAIFEEKVSIAFYKLSLQLYRQTYIDCCALLRSRAEKALQQVNEALIIYAANQTDVTSMQISDEEGALLDCFCRISGEESQTDITFEHISSIDDLIGQINNAFY